MALIAQDEGRGAFLRVAPAPPDEDEAAQQREVGRGVASAGAGFVLEPGGVAGMVVFVFDAPPAADGDQGVSWGEGLAEDEDPPAGAGFAGGLSVLSRLISKSCAAWTKPSCSGVTARER